MNYTKVRGDKSKSETVSVNHRALITRTLTKYPVDYALYRELLQNSADAGATTASIEFEPQEHSYRENVNKIHTVGIRRLVFRNNGAEFAEEDWNRLKEIARGNPNEAKIGAFGVGFYSVFELTDEPLVHSGQSIMNFHYNGDQLQYNRTSGEPVRGTLIDLPYRAPGTLPDLVKFIAFLTQSFMLVPLEQIELKLGDLRLLRLSKSFSQPVTVPFPPQFGKKSPNGTLKMNKITSTSFQVNIDYLNATQMPPATLKSAAGLFSFGKKLVSSLMTGSDDPNDYTKLICFLRKADAVIDVSVTSSFRKQMVATVMKPPPAQATMSLLSHTKEEREMSDIKPPLSDYIFPSEFSDSKIFIGFPTKQTTAFKSHLAVSQLIPTMERTAVDMSNAFVKDWNGQMLYMAGVLARCVYEHELSTLLQNQNIAHQLEMAQYTMRRFEIGPSMPDASVGRWISTGFWRSSTVVLVPTNKGIMPSTRVRTAGSARKIIRNLPILAVTEEGNTFVEQMKQLDYIRPVTPDEVITDLESDLVDTELLSEAITWVKDSANHLSEHQFKAWKNAIVIRMPDGNPIMLGKTDFYQNAYTIPQGLPLPPACLSQAVVSIIGEKSCRAIQLEELSVPKWVSFVVKSYKDLKPYAEELFMVIDRAWSSLNQTGRSSIVQALKDVPCVPTIRGMQVPNNAYLAKIRLFPDLPVITDNIRASKSVLLQLGLRESVDMAFVLETLHNPPKSFKWTTADLVAYLEVHSDTLKKEDWNLLRKGSFYKNRATGDLDQIKSLYAPEPELIRLGFPVLDWAQEWKSSSKGAKILKKLGLRSQPYPVEVFNRAIERNLLPTALQFYLAHYDDEISAAELRKADLPIVPSKGTHVKPSECFLDEEAALFGLNVIEHRYVFAARKLGIKQKPPTKTMVNYLLNHPPRTMTEGDPLFAYLSKRVGDLSHDDIQRCSEVAFLPVRPAQKMFLPPTMLFLDTSDAAEFKGLFHSINAAPESVPFLLKVGVRQSPTLVEVAREAVKSPERAYALVGSPAKYQQLLSMLHSHWSRISRDRDLVQQMRNSAWLLAYRYDEPDLGVSSATLARPADIVIVDNVIIHNQFKSKIYTAPQDSTLEQLYSNLGSITVSQALTESYSLGKAVESPEQESVTAHIHERFRLFLESTSKERKMKPKEVAKIQVEFVSSIKLRRKLLSVPAVEQNVSAYAVVERPFLIWLTPKFDWFDVSQAVSRSMLTKPDPESVIVLEMQLSTDLDVLQRKGYNVSRLLKKEESEQLQLTMDEKIAPPRYSEDEKITQSGPRIETPAAIQNKAAAPLAPSKTMDLKPAVPQLSQLVSRSPQVDNARKPGIPKSDSTLSKGLKSIWKWGPGLGASETASKQPGIKESNVDVDRQLTEGLQKTRAFTEASLNSNKHVDIPDVIPEFCEGNEFYDIKLYATLPNGTNLFLKTGHATPTLAELAYAAPFITVLQHCSEIYRFPLRTLSLYISDPKSIAFNYNGSLFFNLAVFVNQMKNNQWDAATLTNYWFVIMAHELAHNLVSSHGSQHSFYTESYIHTYMGQLRALNVPAITAP